MKGVGAACRDRQGFTLVELLVTLAVLGLVMAAVLNIYMTGNMIGIMGQNQAEAQQGARAAMMMEEDLRMAGYGFPGSQSRFTAASPTAVSFWADLRNASTTLTAIVNPGDTVLNVGSTLDITAGNTIYLINGGQWQTLIVSAVGASTITVPAPGAAAAYPQGAQVGRPRLVIYSWIGGTLTLSKDAGDGTGLQPLATGVQAFQLRYFDVNDGEILPANLATNLGNIRRIQMSVTAQSATAQYQGTFAITSSVRPRNL